MGNQLSAPYMRFKWKNIIIPLSEVREIQLGETSNKKFVIRFYYVNTAGSYSTIALNTQKERDDLLERINKLLTNGSWNRESSWTDLTPPPKPVDINQTIDNIHQVLETKEPKSQETSEKLEAKEPKSQETSEKLEAKDNRPAWLKFLRPNP